MYDLALRKFAAGGTPPPQHGPALPPQQHGPVLPPPEYGPVLPPQGSSTGTSTSRGTGTSTSTSTGAGAGADAGTQTAEEAKKTPFKEKVKKLYGKAKTAVGNQVYTGTGDAKKLRLRAKAGAGLLGAGLLGAGAYHYNNRGE